MRHELVQKIVDNVTIPKLNGRIELSINQLEIEVTRWLEERANHMEAVAEELKNFNRPAFRHILGLTPKEDGRVNAQEKWCEHINQIGGEFVVFGESDIHKFELSDTFKFCPICAAPRPAKELTLEEKLLKTYLDWYGTGKPLTNNHLASMLAETATTHFNNQKKD